MGSTGWAIDLAVKRRTANFGYPRGTKGQNRPVIFIDHIIEGWKATLDAASWREPHNKGMTFAVGRDGSKSQYTSILDAHWANGQNRDRNLYNPTGNVRLAAMKFGGNVWQTARSGHNYLWDPRRGCNVWNGGSISIEHEGFHGDSWADAMIQGSVDIKLWCLEELALLGTPMITEISQVSEILGAHYYIDPGGVAGTAAALRRCAGVGWRNARLAMTTRLQTALRADPAKYGLPVPIPKPRPGDAPVVLGPIDVTTGGWTAIQIRGRREVYRAILKHVKNPEELDDAGIRIDDIELVDDGDPRLDLPVYYGDGVPEDLR